MSLKLFTRFLLAVTISVFVVSCMDDTDYDEYVPPTKAEELALLNTYLDTLENRGVNIDTTDLGIYYIIDSVGNGTFPTDGNTCFVTYTGFFVTGEIFDGTGSTPMQFELSTDNGYIEGWNDGMRVFDEGAQGYLIIPSEFAYGESGYSSVPPNTTLIFNVEMEEIK